QTSGAPAGVAPQVASNTRGSSVSSRQVVEWDTGGSQPAPRSAPAASDDPLAALVAQNEIRDSAPAAAHAVPASYQPAVRPATASVRPPVLAQPQAAPVVRAAAYNRRAGAGTKPPEHFVTQGETLYSLAKRYGTTVDDLKALNNIGTEGLKAGLRLRLPGTAIRG